LNRNFYKSGEAIKRSQQLQNEFDSLMEEMKEGKHLNNVGAG